MPHGIPPGWLGHDSQDKRNSAVQQQLSLPFSLLSAALQTSGPASVMPALPSSACLPQLSQDKVPRTFSISTGETENNVKISTADSNAQI